MGTTSMWFDIDFGLWNWLPAWEPVHIPFQPMIFRLPDLGPAPHVFSFVGRCKSQCLATESQWSTELTWTWTTIANGSTSQGGKGFDLFGKRCSKRKWCWLFGCVCRLDILINLYIIHIIHTTYIYTQYHLLCVYTHIYTYIYIYIFAFGICILGKSFIGHFQSLSLLVCRKVLNPHRHFAFFQKRCQWNPSTSIRYHAFLVPKLQLQDVLHAMSSRNFSSPQVPADNGPMPLFIRGSGCLISISNGRAKMLALKLVSRDNWLYRMEVQIWDDVIHIRPAAFFKRHFRRSVLLPAP